MLTYVFILGNNPELSIAELKAVLPMKKFSMDGATYIRCQTENEIDCSHLLRRLGGTIKIGRVISDRVSKENIVEDLLGAEEGKKIVFGLSEYYARVKSMDLKYKTKTQHLGMEIKKELKDKGKSIRFVVSRDPVLSSVVVTKNKCQEYMILDNAMLAKTCAVQEFEEYSERDYGRPRRDPKSGMLPPKLCKIMINISRAKPDDILLDPFCGSGTILQEAILLGFKNVIGCDISEKAVDDTKKNMEWLNNELRIRNHESGIFPSPVPAAAGAPSPAAGRGNFQGEDFFSSSPSPWTGEGGGEGGIKVFQADVRELTKHIQKADVIVTEPYLGPALRGNETMVDINKIKTELERLYIDAFREFSKILEKDARIVIVMPVWKTQDAFIRMNIGKDIQNIGYVNMNPEELLYGRSDQRVVREIVVWKRG